MNLLIRKAHIKDAGSLAELDKACFSLPWSKNTFALELGKNRLSLYLVAEVDGQIAGYAGLWEVLDEGHITNVVVHPKHRRKGIGESLLSELFQISKTTGIKRYTLEVRASNKSAINLYKRLGFKAVGIRREYYSDNLEDALILWKDE
jgi:ribosomal-protein-alanine N-acetyltransferase